MPEIISQTPSPIENAPIVPKQTNSQIKSFKNSKLFLPIIISAGIILLLLTAGLIHSIVSNQKIKSFEKQRLLQLAEREKQQKEELYNRFQAIPTTAVTSIPISQIKARGNQKLILVLTKPSNLPLSSIAPLLDILNSQSQYSFSFIKDYLKKQAEKYNINDFDLNIEIHGIYSLPDLTKVGDLFYVWDKDPFATIKLEDDFNKILTENNITVNENDLVVFLYFDDSNEKSGSSAEDRFYESKKFRSFAKDTKKTAYVNIYNFSSAFAPIADEIITHEILHFFGAVDKYVENSQKPECNDKALGNPDKNPLFPQTTGDIMCGYVEFEKDKYKTGDFLKNNLVINKYTAQEIGWSN